MADALSLTILNNIAKKVNKAECGIDSSKCVLVKHLSVNECSLLSSILHKYNSQKRNSINKDAVPLDTFINDSIKTSKNVCHIADLQDCEDSNVHERKGQSLTLDDLAEKCRQSR